MQRRFWRKGVLLSVIALLALICSYWAATFNNKADVDIGPLQTSLKQATLLPVGFRQVPEFKMHNQHQQIVGRELFIDNWSLVFFGYISCPDICPVSMSLLKQVREILANVQKQTASFMPQIVFVSVDPARDNAERLKNYIDYFDKDFIGLSGSQAETLKLARALGIVYKADNDAPAKADYLVDHSATFLLINPTAGLRAILSAPHDAKTIAHDYQKIVGAIH